MTREEFKSLMANASDPNKMAETLAAINTGVEDLFDAADASAAKAKEDAETINQLRDSNMRLFLKVSGAEETDPEPEEETFEQMQERLRNMIVEE